MTPLVVLTVKPIGRPAAPYWVSAFVLLAWMMYWKLVWFSVPVAVVALVITGSAEAMIRVSTRLSDPY